MSYAKFLYPTNALVVRKADAYGAVPPCRASAPRSLPGTRYKPVTAKTIPAGTDIGKDRASSVITGAHSRKGRGFSETAASGQCVVGMEVLVSAVQMMSLRTEASTNSLHPPDIWPSSVYAIQEAQNLSLGT